MSDATLTVVASDPRRMSPIELVEHARGRELRTLEGRLLPVDEQPYLAYLATYTNLESRETMRLSLRLAAEVLYGGPCDPATFPWWWLRRTHVQLMLGKLVERGLAPATVNRVRAAVRGVLGACFDAEVVSAEHYTRITRVKRVTGSRETSGRALEPAEVARMRAGCATGTPLGLRDSALLETLVQTGLRRDEATYLDLKNYRRGELQVIGKGNKQRSVRVNDRLATTLERWLGLRGRDDGPLFHPFSPSGALQRGRRLSYSGMQAAVLALAKRVGVADVSMHDFRRTLISELLDEGVDIATVARIVGHASTNTTAKYDRRGERAASEALDRHGAKT